MKKVYKPLTATIIRKFIEENFMIDNAITGEFVPFIFNKVQDRLWKELIATYGEEGIFHGLREMWLKARKEGFTSLVLAVFAAICMLSEHSPRFLEISYKEDATSQHFRRFKNFILSCFTRDPKKWTRELERKVFKTIEEGSELVIANKLSSFYCGTASSKTGERGGTVQGILFSEAAHYPDTGIINASEIIDGTSSMVAVNEGMVIQETTANGFNHWKRSWDLAKSGELTYHPRFFGWREFYTQEQYDEICRGFTDKSLIPQEFPETENDSFLTSGRPIFKTSILKEMELLCDDPIFIGNLDDDEKEIRFKDDPKGTLKVWKTPRQDKKYAIWADIAGGIEDITNMDPRDLQNRCWSVACVQDRSSWEVVAELRLRVDPGEFGRMLVTLGEYYNWAIVCPELNNHGHATIEAMKAKGYPHIFKSSEIMEDKKNEYGFPTNERTKALALTALRNAIESKSYKENSRVAIGEMYEAVFDENGKLSSHGWLDCVITRMIGLYCLKFLSLDDTYRARTNDDSAIVAQSVINPRVSRFKRRRAA